MTTRTLGRLFMLFALSGGIVGLSSGCDALDKLKGNKDDSSKKEKKSKKDKDDDEEEEDDDKGSSSAASTSGATSSAASGASSSSGGATNPDDVKRYPEETPASGTFVTKKAFTVYQAADTSSKELGHLGPGTLINLKATFSNWMLVEWPSGVGELSLGWLQVQVRDTTIQQTQAPVDAGTPVDAAKPVDASVPVIDAGKPDAGRHTIPPLHRRP